MLIRELVALAERLEADGDIPAQMHQYTRVRWLLDLTPEGHLIGFISLLPEDAKGPAKRGTEHLAPHVDRRYAIKPKLLVDRADYALGVVDSDALNDEGKRERVAECHRAFVDLVTRCATQTAEPAVAAVESFLRSLDLAKCQVPAELLATDVVMFRVDGVLPSELPSVRRFWAESTQPSGDEQAQRVCIGCGQMRLPESRHPVPIKGIPQGQTSGMQLVSANANAFESYGLEASLIVPVCHTCAERYGQALNRLLRDERSHLNIGRTAYVWWTRDRHDFGLASLLTDPDPADVQALLASVRTGSAQAPVHDEDFFVAALTASGGRVAVRDWLVTSLPEIRASLARFFLMQRLVSPRGEPGRPLGVYALAGSTVREMKDLDVRTVDALAGCALHGRPLPVALLERVLQRARVSGRSGSSTEGAKGAPAGSSVVTRPRAALIKLILSSRLDLNQGDGMEQLDPGLDDPAYLCGRLLAVLERAQEAAVSAKATIVDRFYGSASTAPLSVFPRLVRGCQSHLSTLRKEKPDVYRALQTELEAIMAQISEFTRTLSLAEQGLFALGYYHQRAEGRRMAIAR